MKKTLRYVLYALPVLLIVAQAFRIDKSVPEYDRSQDFLALMQAPQDVADLMRAACYDCHSYESKYPWYAEIAPVSWWVKQHINEGREHLNLSLYGSWSPKKRSHKIEECIESLKEGWMPLKSYTRGHPEARLSESQRTAISAWLAGLPDAKFESEHDH